MIIVEGKTAKNVRDISQMSEEAEAMFLDGKWFEVVKIGKIRRPGDSSNEMIEIILKEKQLWKKILIIQKKKKLEKIVTKSFETSEQLEKYYKKNQVYFDEFDNVLQQIRQLEWDLMTPEQQARDLEVRRMIRLKTGQINEDGEKIQQ